MRNPSGMTALAMLVGNGVGCIHVGVDTSIEKVEGKPAGEAPEELRQPLLKGRKGKKSRRQRKLEKQLGKIDEHVFQQDMNLEEVFRGVG